MTNAPVTHPDSAFSLRWLALREPVDHRSRNQQLADALKSRFLQREQITVVDLGCGTGSNVRATAQLLPDQQSWTLVDHDPALLASARTALIAWADSSDISTGQLTLRKGRAGLSVTFRCADLAKDLDAVLGPKPDLVTASAFFDLASEPFIRQLAAAVANRRAVFYTVLTYNGIQRWSPRGPLDQQLNAAFHRHQMTDKGLGVSAGPTAPVILADQFQTHGYGLAEGDSPWRLGAQDQALVDELAKGFANAVRQTKALTDAEIDAWLKRGHTSAEVGHTDTLAIPGLQSRPEAPSDADA
jgi:SAM-dependent methyltransferase